VLGNVYLKTNKPKKALVALGRSATGVKYASVAFVYNLTLLLSTRSQWGNDHPALAPILAAMSAAHLSLQNSEKCEVIDREVTEILTAVNGPTM